MPKVIKLWEDAECGYKDCILHNLCIFGKGNTFEPRITHTPAPYGGVIVKCEDLCIREDISKNGTNK